MVVEPLIVALLLAAALMHASWNALLKADRSDRLATFGVIMTTGTVMGQIQNANGIFASDDTIGALDVEHMYKERSEDQWIQSALTIEGKDKLADDTHVIANCVTEVTDN